MLGDHSAPRDGRCALTSSSPRDARPRPVQLHAQHVRPCHSGARASGGRAVGCRACGRLRGLAGRLTARRGQRRGQAGWNRSAPGATGADSRAADGADTEIRTQDLLFTNSEVPVTQPDCATLCNILSHDFPRGLLSTRCVCNYRPDTIGSRPGARREVLPNPWPLKRTFGWSARDLTVARDPAGVPPQHGGRAIGRLLGADERRSRGRSQRASNALACRRG